MFNRFCFFYRVKNPFPSKFSTYLPRSSRHCSALPGYYLVRPTRPQKEPPDVILLTGLTGIVSAILIASVVGPAFIFYEGFTGENSTIKSTEKEPFTVMVGKIAPGRSGNLTSEQEADLKELWTQTLRVFGVLSKGQDGVSEVSSQEGVLGHPDADSTESEKKQKKKRGGLFSKKHHGPELSAGSRDQVADPEDKFGQVKEYNQAIANTSPQDLRMTFWSMVKSDHPDDLLLRFLRARKWDVEKALIMLISTMHWRSQDMHVDDDIILRGEAGAVADGSSTNGAVKKEGDDFMAQIRIGKSYLHGADKDGRPLCIVRARLHKPGEQTLASLERFTVYTIETARLLLSSPVDTATIIFDMTGFSLANMDYSPVKFMIKCFEANYPESLGVILVHKAPWIFQGIWKVIKGWLDPVVASKVHFTNNVEELEHFIVKSRIMKELGGEDPWTYKYIEPRPGENEPMQDDTTRSRLLQERKTLVKEYESATKQWIRVPAIDNEVQSKRNELAARMRISYWQLDPYLRARTLYDRTGLIAQGGGIDVHPSSNGTVISSAEKGPLPAVHNPNDLD